MYLIRMSLWYNKAEQADRRVLGLPYIGAIAKAICDSGTLRPHFGNHLANTPCLRNFLSPSIVRTSNCLLNEIVVGEK